MMDAIQNAWLWKAIRDQMPQPTMRGYTDAPEEERQPTDLMGLRGQTVDDEGLPLDFGFGDHTTDPYYSPPPRPPHLPPWPSHPEHDIMQEPYTPVRDKRYPPPVWPTVQHDQPIHRAHIKKWPLPHQVDLSGLHAGTLTPEQLQRVQGAMGFEDWNLDPTQDHNHRATSPQWGEATLPTGRLRYMFGQLDRDTLGALLRGEAPDPPPPAPEMMGPHQPMGPPVPEEHGPPVPRHLHSTWGWDPVPYSLLREWGLDWVYPYVRDNPPPLRVDPSAQDRIMGIRRRRVMTDPTMWLRGKHPFEGTLFPDRGPWREQEEKARRTPRLRGSQ